MEAADAFARAGSAVLAFEGSGLIAVEADRLGMISDP